MNLHFPLYRKKNLSRFLLTYAHYDQFTADREIACAQELLKARRKKLNSFYFWVRCFSLSREQPMIFQNLIRLH